MPLTRSASPRLWAYAWLAVGGLVTALATGRPGVAVAVVPVALVALAGVVLAEAPAVSVRLELGQDRAEEDSLVRGELTVVTNLPRGRIDLIVPTSGPVEIVEPAGVLGWSTEGTGTERVLPFELRAARWGLVQLGPPWMRAFGPLGLVRWEGPAGRSATLRVVPAATTLARLLPHPDPRAAAGVHLARRPGDGIELADVRPYHPGDRLRSVNWPLSTRRTGLWVNERRPDRAADLVVVIDTFADGPHGASLALGRSARVAWLLASAHLRSHDRVGLVGFGGYPAWITPGSGERARLAFLDRLLATSAAWTEAQRSVRMLPRPALPPGALVVVVTALHDQRMITGAAELRRRGLAVAVVQVDVADLLPEEGGPSWEAARRLWALELQRRAAVLTDAGIPVVAWPGGADPAGVLEALRRALRAPVFRRRPA